MGIIDTGLLCKLFCLTMWWFLLFFCWNQAMCVSCHVPEMPMKGGGGAHMSMLLAWYIAVFWIGDWLQSGHMQQVIVLFSSWPYGKQSVCVVTSLPHHPCVYLWCHWLVYDVLSHGSSCPLDWLTCIILVKIINAVLFLIRTKICALRRAVVSMLLVQLRLS